jgi:Cu(I)/Ag(I) efflux system membrane fusion protein
MKRSLIRTIAIGAIFSFGIGAGIILAPHVSLRGAASTAEIPKSDDGKGEQPPKKGKKILYYKNPMGYADTSPVPKKDSMGMDYIPVYEGDEEDGNVVKVSIDKVQKLGVQTEAVATRDLMRTIRATGTVQFDESRQIVVQPRFEGWIEHLRVSRTGAPVKKGQILLEVYSPEISQAQHEYLAARGLGRGGANDPLATAALQRMRNLGVGEDEIQRLVRERTHNRLIAVRAPSDGIIMEKKATEGMRIMPGEALFRIADNSSVWVIGDIYEQDLAWVRDGQAVRATVTAYPGRVFNGRVTYIYPNVAAATRTGRIRVELENADGALKADMYASVEVAAEVGTKNALVVPASAVLDSGTRQLVLIERSEGRYEPRIVKLGAKADGYYEVIEGVQEGEKVVVAANFLIDSESNLQAALRAFTNKATQKSDAEKSAEKKDEQK